VRSDKGSSVNAGWRHSLNADDPPTAGQDGQTEIEEILRAYDRAVVLTQQLLAFSRNCSTRSPIGQAIVRTARGWP
jgi:hypothetical protein